MGMAVDNNTVVMKFDPGSLEIQFMWNISLNHHQVGNGQPRFTQTTKKTLDFVEMHQYMSAMELIPKI